MIKHCNINFFFLFSIVVLLYSLQVIELNINTKQHNKNTSYFQINMYNVLNIYIIDYDKSSEKLHFSRVLKSELFCFIFFHASII